MTIFPAKVGKSRKHFIKKKIQDPKKGDENQHIHPTENNQSPLPMAEKEQKPIVNVLFWQFLKNATISFKTRLSHIIEQKQRSSRIDGKIMTKMIRNRCNSRSGYQGVTKWWYHEPELWRFTEDVHSHDWTWPTLLFYIDILLWLYFRIPTTEWSHESKISLFPISYIFLAIYPTKKKTSLTKTETLSSLIKTKLWV